MPKPLFDKSGGYRKLYSFTFATMIQLGTLRFCRRFISFRDDPLGKSTGQMNGAARSGRQNIVEASERAGTSKETEIKLTDVSRASLAELLGDFEMYLADRGEIPWSMHSAEHQAVAAITPAPFEYTEDVLHDYWTYFHEARKPFAKWLDSGDPVVVANVLIVLIRRTMAMLHAQIEHQGQAFLDSGGFRERLYQCRTAARDEADGTVAAAPAPECPKCGQTMRRRTARTGRNAGRAFWSCAAYPECKGTRDIPAAEARDPKPQNPGHRTQDAGAATQRLDPGA
jgi:four helix bundle suffix protein